MKIIQMKKYICIILFLFCFLQPKIEGNQTIFLLKIYYDY